MMNNIHRNNIMDSMVYQQNSRAINRFHSFGPRHQMSKSDIANLWCETCDRGFATVHLLEQHKQQHQKCNIDGCQFIAHPKVVTKHIQMQHSTGVYKKIAKLDNPEDIKKWREERKKNFPTKSNIDKKAAVLNEKIKRGEKMGLQNNRPRHHKNDGNIQLGKKRKYENKNNQKQHFNRNKKRTLFSETTKTENTNQTVPKKLPKVIPTFEQNRKLKPFAGIQNILVDDQNEDKIETLNNDMLIEDDDDDDYIDKSGVSNIQESLVNVEEPAMCNALTSLISNYESSDEDNVVTDDSFTSSLKHISKVQKNMHKINDRDFSNTNSENNITKECKESQKNICDSKTTITEETVEDDSGPEEVAIVKDNMTEAVNGHSENKTDCQSLPRKSKNENTFKHKNIAPVRPKPKLPSTLLQKLLFKEIKHERNIILQCVRYISLNNYFDKKTE